MSPHKAGDRKARLQFGYALRKRPGLLKPAKKGQGSSLQDMREAESGIGTYCVATGRDCFLPIARGALGDCQPHIGVPDFRVQWANAERALSVFDRLRGSPCMVEDDRT